MARVGCVLVRAAGLVAAVEIVEAAMRKKIRAAAVRAVRTFIQTFLGVYVAGLMGVPMLRDLMNRDLLDTATASAIVAVLAFVQNAVETWRDVAYDRG